MRGWRIWLTGAAIVFVVAAAAMTIARGARPGVPTGDIAVIEGYTIQASEGHLLVGPYSRFQWHHPGPIYFYALAPFYRASHHHTAGLNAAALVLNVSMIALAILIAGTSGGPVLAAMVAAVSALYVVRTGDLLVSAWNPHVVVLPIVVTALASAAAAAGDPWLLPVAALAASFAAETHAGTLPVCVLLCGAAFVALLASAMRASGARRTAKALAATVLIVVIAWLPSIVEQIRDTPGNLTALWNFFSAGPAGGQPFHAAFVVWASMLSGIVRPDFALARGVPLRVAHSPASQAWAIGEVVLLMLVALASHRARRRFDMLLALFLLAASLVALWSVTRVLGDVIDHEIFWISALGALNAAVILSAGVRIAAPRTEALLSRPAAIVSFALLAGCALSGLWRLAGIRTRSFTPGSEAAAIERAASGIHEFLDREGIVRPFVDVDQQSWTQAAGVLLQLQKAGVAYAVDDDWLPMFTDVARATGREQVVVSITGAEQHEMLRGRPGVVPLLESDPVYVDTYGESSKR